LGFEAPLSGRDKIFVIFQFEDFSKGQSLMMEASGKAGECNMRRAINEAYEFLRSKAQLATGHSCELRGDDTMILTLINTEDTEDTDK
jgi:hypothetical protein